MELAKENLIMIIGAVVVTLLQLVVAPYVVAFNAMPNFMAAYTIVVAVVRPRSSRTCILAFAMGLLYNLFVGGIVGSMAVVLIAATVLASFAMRALANDTHFQPVVIMAAMLLVVEVVYLMVLLASGLGLGFFQALMFRALPCAVYDIVVGIALYAIMSRLAAVSERMQPNHGPTLLR